VSYFGTICAPKNIFPLFLPAKALPPAYFCTTEQKETATSQPVNYNEEKRIHPHRKSSTIQPLCDGRLDTILPDRKHFGGYSGTAITGPAIPGGP